MQDGKERGKESAADSVKEGMRAAKELGKASEQTAKAVSATVKAGAKTGKALSQITTGAAAGPWGAAFSAAWSMRHTLFKVLVCICLALLFLVVLIVSLPAMLLDYLFGGGGQDAFEVYDRMMQPVYACVQAGYAASLERAEEMMSKQEYDAALTEDAFCDLSGDLRDAACFVVAAYSASEREWGMETLVYRLSASEGAFFPVTCEEKRIQGEREVVYAECVIHPFAEGVIWEMLGLNPQSQYEDFNATYEQAVRTMAKAMSETFERR